MTALTNDVELKKKNIIIYLKKVNATANMAKLATAYLYAYLLKQLNLT